MSDIGGLTKKLEEDVNRADTWANGPVGASYTAKDGAKVLSIRTLSEKAEINTRIAEESAKKAEAAATAAQIGTGLFPSVEAGLSKTKDGDLFNVVAQDGSDFVILYQNKSGAAVELKKYPSSEFIIAINKNIRSDAHNKFAVKSSAKLDNVLFSITDELNNRTWVEANASDGGLTNLSQYFIEKKLDVSFRNARSAVSNLLFAITDQSGVVTDLCVDEKGRLPDFVIKSIVERMPNTLINMGIFGSSTLQDMHQFFPKVFKNTNVGSFLLGGDSGAVIESVSARIGSNSPKISFSTSEIVTIENTVITNWHYDSAMMSWHAVIENGVSGIISCKENSYIFTPDNIDTNISVNENELYSVVPSFSLDQNIFIINAGKNNLTNSNTSINSADHVFSQTKIISDYLIENNKKYIIIGHFVNTGQSSAVADQIKNTNSQLKKKYGLLFFDISEYLCSNQVWADTGIVPTDQDYEYQLKGELAPSLSRNTGHMNMTTSEVVCMKIKEMLVKLKYINEV